MTNNRDWRQLEKRGKLFIACLLMGVLAYGYNLFNFTLPIDGENSENFLQTVSLGRWTHSFIRLHFLPEPFLPYFTNLVSIIFLSLTAVLLSHTLQLKTHAAYIFAPLFITFPGLSYQFEFINQADTISIGYFLAAAAAHLIITNNDKSIPKQIGAAAFSCLAIVLSISIYQALVVIPIVVVLGKLLIDSYDTNRKSLYFLRNAGFALLVTGLALMLYFALTNAIKYKYLGSSEGTNSYLLHFITSSTSLTSIVAQGALNVASGLTGDIRYGFKPYLVCSCAAGLTVVCALLRKNGNFLYRCLLVAAILVAPFLIVALSGSYIPGRVLVAANLSFAIIITNEVRFLVARAPTISSIAITLLSLINIAAITSLFYSDTAVRNHDISVANSIKTIMMLNNPTFDQTKNPVYFHGGIREISQYKIPNSDVFGSSFFTWDYGNNRRISRFFKYYAIGHFQTATKEEILQIKDKIEAMPVWPNPNSVRLIDGIMVVKLHQKPGFLPFAYQ